jgi:uncharacterized protein (TIGR03435 family)
MKLALAALVSAFLATAHIALAQSAAPALADKPLAFEVASIRPHGGPLYSIADFSSSGPHVLLGTYTLRHLIMEAYNLKPYQLHVPEATDRPNTYYDIAASAPEEERPTRDDFRRMLQTLLADRFQLKAHFEKKNTPVYALVITKGGPKLTTSSEQTPPKTLFGVNGRNQFIRTDSITMPQLADDLNNFLGADRPIIDRTGLTGTYKLRIEATPEWRNRDPQSGDLSIFTAVQEQLGLKLEPSTAPLDILVIDSAQKPSEN